MANSTQNNDRNKNQAGQGPGQPGQQNQGQHRDSSVGQHGGNSPNQNPGQNQANRHKEGSKDNAK